jgi:S-methylmethionine-dependent homocysteine/selenocysteine methylase|tara:strand:+ start:116711 stop:117613 length:903 start_codon:yes stop_codon:yes gene_type:complete
MGDIILLDGGTGQELIKRSAAKATPLWSSQVMLDAPELVQDVHADFINAGAKIITLNNYTATPARLKRDASLSLLKPLHEAAISAAEKAVAQTQRSDIRIAACLPPLMASYVADIVPSEDECLEQYNTLVSLQSHASDLFICETMSTIHEARAAVIAAKAINAEIWVGFALDERTNNLRSGETLQDAIAAMNALNVDAILLNCASPKTIGKNLKNVITSTKNAGAYANAFESVEALAAGGSVECLIERRDISPEEYAAYCLNWVDAGARIIGGCCAIGPGYIAQLHDALIQKGHHITNVI